MFRTVTTSAIALIFGAASAAALTTGPTDGEVRVSDDAIILAQSTAVDADENVINQTPAETEETDTERLQPTANSDGMTKPSGAFPAADGTKLDADENTINEAPAKTDEADTERLQPTE